MQSVKGSKRLLISFNGTVVHPPQEKDKNIDVYLQVF